MQLAVLALMMVLVSQSMCIDQIWDVCITDYL